MMFRVVGRRPTPEYAPVHGARAWLWVEGARAGAYIRVRSGVLGSSLSFCVRVRCRGHPLGCVQENREIGWVGVQGAWPGAYAGERSVEPCRRLG